MRHIKKLGITVAAASAALVAALAPAAQAGDLSVCNQRENSPHASGLVPMGPNADPKGRGDATVGSGKASKGLQRAADNSPALTTCGTPEDNSAGSGSSGSDGGSGGDGGGDIIIIS